MLKHALRKPALLLSASAFAGLLPACTGQLPGSFRLQQQQENFAADIQVNTKIDLLWVVDNSSSMDISQEKLRNGFTAFAKKYMQPTWDIHVAVITTDTYMANPAFAKYLATTVPATTGWTSPYISSRLSTFTNPSFDPNMVNLSTGAMDHGVSFGEVVPVWGSSFSLLLPGLHDGPIPGLCFEGMPYFLNGQPFCRIRDAANANTGPSHCLTPGPGESSVTQCVNTVENNTIHSGKAIISTMPPTGVAADQNWTNQLVDDFMVNVTTGSAGHGSERGLGSVMQMMNDNEFTNTAFFRPNATRGIIIVSDEDDQTMVLPSPAPAGFNPWTHYMCDQSSLLAMNSATPSRITGVNGFCCSTPGNNCQFGSEGTSCPAKTVDGYTYTISICPVLSYEIPVSQIKAQFDQFFLNLDGPNATTPNYFVTSIVALTGQSIAAMQATRDQDDVNAGANRMIAVDRADRYINLGNLVGNGSMAMDIGSSDYSATLDAIGQAILQQKSTFTLTRAPTNQEEMIVTIIHADGSSTLITPDKYVINGKSIMITDSSIVLGFASTDQLSINYQPKTVF